MKEIKNSDSYKKANNLLRHLIKGQVKRTADSAEIINQINNIVTQDIGAITNFLNKKNNNSEKTNKGLGQRLEILQLMLEIVKTEEFSQQLDNVIKKELENKEEPSVLRIDSKNKSTDENVMLPQQENNSDEEFKKTIKDFLESSERHKKEAEALNQFFNEYFARSRNARGITKSSCEDEENRKNDSLLEDR